MYSISYMVQMCRHVTESYLIEQTCGVSQPSGKFGLDKNLGTMLLIGSERLIHNPEEDPGARTHYGRHSALWRHVCTL